MPDPAIAVVVPTQGRETLERLFDSIDVWLGDDDRVFVCIDLFEMPAAKEREVHRRIVARGHQYITLRLDAGHHCWGHCQNNETLEAVARLPTPYYVVCNDDDDTFTREAGDMMRDAIAFDIAQGAQHMHIFRFMTPWGTVLPAGTALYEGGVGGHCLFGPASMTGRFTCRYAGDWDWIKENLDSFPLPPAFWPGIITYTRRRQDEG